MRSRAVVTHRDHHPGQCAVRHVEYAVEMQTIRLGRAFPHSDIFPTSALAEVGQALLQPVSKGMLCMQFVIVRKRAEIVEFLQIGFATIRAIPKWKFYIL